MNSLERIEVIKGPGSVLYGSDAFSGVINLITQKASGRRFHLSSGAGAGANASAAEISFERGALQLHGDNLGNRPVWLPVWLPDWGYGSGDTLPARAGRTVLFGIEVWQKQ